MLTFQGTTRVKFVIFANAIIPESFFESNAVVSELGKWGRTQMGSDGFNRILTGFSRPGYGLDPLKHMVSRDLDRILAGF